MNTSILLYRPADTHANIQSWLRPSFVARYMLGSDMEMAIQDMFAPEKPADWQAQLANMILEGSFLVSDPAWPGYIRMLQMHGKCNTTFQVSHQRCFLESCCALLQCSALVHRRIITVTVNVSVSTQYAL